MGWLVLESEAMMVLGLGICLDLNWADRLGNQCQEVAKNQAYLLANLRLKTGKVEVWNQNYFQLELDQALGWRRSFHPAKSG